MANRRMSPQPKSRSRNTRRKREPTFGERVRNSYTSAQNRRSHRGNSRGSNRRSTMTRQAAIAGSADYDDPDYFSLPALKRFLHWIFALGVAPLCLVTIITLFQRVGHENFLSSFWRSKEFFHFSVGVVLMMAWFLTAIANDFFLLLYVLGHEMTHATFVYLCGGRISDLHFSTDGGYIMTNKSNILIALSPYFVPFWSVVSISLYGFVGFFYPLPFSEEGLILLLGGTWCFHVIWTIWMIPKDQPDLKEHGTFFSLMIIVLANLIVLTVLLCVTLDHLTIKDFAWNWWNNILDLSEALVRLLSVVL